MRRFAALAFVVSIVAAACGGSSGGGGASDLSAQAPAKDVKPAAKIVWWHAMTGVNAAALNKIVDGYNKSQGVTQVEAVFQGTYDDLLSKLNTALASKAAPALAQVYDIGQAYMRDAAEVTPMQAFIDRDKFDTSDFESAVINYYKYQDKLQSMPFNASSAVLFYSKDAFKEVGLDPEKPPKTFSEVADYAKKLVKKDASGATVRAGFAPSIYGWFFEQALAVSGSLYADNGNGRDDRATKLVYNNAEGKAILDWWKAGLDGGYFTNPGIDNDGAKAAFSAGKTAMYLESTASLRGHINDAKFQVGVGRFPKPDNASADGGNIIGGASLYIMKSRPPEEQQAAWEFVKYVMTPAVQAQWQSDTGYYPVRKAAYNEGPSKEWATKYPQFLVAIDQIRTAPQNRKSNGAVIGVFAQARARTQKMIESVLLGQATSQKALDDAVADMNAQIDKYNKANK